MVHELGPVGQAGERIVAGEITKLRFTLFMIVYVGVGAEPFNDVPVRIAVAGGTG
jgi:hypothetical protein